VCIKIISRFNNTNREKCFLVLVEVNGTYNLYWWPWVGCIIDWRSSLITLYSVVTCLGSDPHVPKEAKSTKARSTPATMSKQNCRMLQCRMLLRYCCRFWQQCRSNVRLCCQKRQKCRTSFALKFRPFDKVERCFDNVAKTATMSENRQQSWMLLRQCCFDIVAGVDRA